MASFRELAEDLAHRRTMREWVIVPQDRSEQRAAPADRAIPE